MTKYIKYLISFFLILGLTVNECSIYLQINSANYHQVSFVNTKSEFNHKQPGLYIYSCQTLVDRGLPNNITIYQNLKNAYDAQIQIILRLRIELSQKISSISAQSIFLSKIITSSNHYSGLYTA